MTKSLPDLLAKSGRLLTSWKSILASDNYKEVPMTTVRFLQKDRAPQHALTSMVRLRAPGLTEAREDLELNAIICGAHPTTVVYSSH